MKMSSQVNNVVGLQHCKQAGWHWNNKHDLANKCSGLTFAPERPHARSSSWRSFRISAGCTGSARLRCEHTH